MKSTYDLIKRFFKAKTEQLLAVSRQAIVEHSTLKGSHREDIINIYLHEILPKRFAIGKGIVYGLLGKSKEADLVIWDEQNYPSLRLHGHSMFFIEASKAIMEIKTNWSLSVFKDIKKKKYTSTKINKSPQWPNLDNRVSLLENQLEETIQDKEPSSFMMLPHSPIDFVGFVFLGGEKFSINNLDAEEITKIEEHWPDLLIFLNAGLVLEKHYVRDDEDRGRVHSYLNLHRAGDNALLIFTSLLLEKLMINTNFSEYPVNFIKYGSPFYEHDIDFIEFPQSGRYKY